MVSIHSQQLAKQLFTRLAYSALLVTLICSTVIIVSRAVSRSRNTKLPVYDKLVSGDFISGLFATRRNKKVEAAILASLLGQNNESVAKRSIPEMEAIQEGTEVLHQQLEQALARIEENIQEES
jgi:hypothetical protein